MEKFRFKQAQELIKEAGKSNISKEVFKTPNEGILDSKTFGEILNEMMDLEEYVYTSKPTHFLNRDDSINFCDQLVAVRNKIDDLLADFGVIEKINVEEEIKNSSSKYLILTTKSNFKKVLTKLSVDPQRIVVAGVPLLAADMKELNPHLPDSVLQSVEKKISHVKNDIDRKKDQFNIENVLVVVENDKPGQLLAKRAEELYNAQILSLESIKDISAEEFLKLLSGL